MICCKSYSMGAGGCSGDSSGGRVDDGTAYGTGGCGGDNGGDSGALWPALPRES